MLPSSPRVFWLCLLAGCAGGPISEFPFGGGEDSAPGSGGGAQPQPPAVSPPGGGNGGPGPGAGDDVGVPNAGDGDQRDPDGGTEDAGEQLPCGLPAEAGDAGAASSATVCEGDYCGLSLVELRSSALPDSVCFTALREVCENRVQQTVSTCQSLVGGADFPTYCARAFFAPELVSDACIACYGVAAACAEQHCGAECAPEAPAEACGTCKELHCGEALRRCSGLAPAE